MPQRLATLPHAPCQVRVALLHFLRRRLWNAALDHMSASSLDTAGTSDHTVAAFAFGCRLIRMSRAGTRAGRILSVIHGLQDRAAREKAALALTAASTAASSAAFLQKSMTSTVKAPRHSVSIHTISASMYKFDKKPTMEQIAEHESASFRGIGGVSGPLAPGNTARSRVGKKLTDLTSRRVIVVVLITALVVPLLESTSYHLAVPPVQAGLSALHRQAQLGPTDTLLFNTSVRAFVQEHANILQLTLYGVSSEVLGSITDRQPTAFHQSLAPYRRVELSRHWDRTCYDADTGQAIHRDGVSCLSSVALDETRVSRRNAVVNLVRTLTVAAVLVAMCFVFVEDAKAMLITPLENMVKSVLLLAENPLAVLLDADEPALIPKSACGVVFRGLRPTPNNNSLSLCLCACVVTQPPQWIARRNHTAAGRASCAVAASATRPASVWSACTRPKSWRRPSVALLACCKLALATRVPPSSPKT